MLSLAALAQALEPPAAPRQPIILRLQGHFTPDAQTARVEGANAISLRVGDAERWFAVDTARSMNALSTVTGPDVLAALAGFKPTLTALGDPALRQRLADVRPGVPVRVEGLVDRGSRTYLLRDVSPAVPSETPTP